MDHVFILFDEDGDSSGVFSTLEKAEAAVEDGEEFTIEEWEIDGEYIDTHSDDEEEDDEDEE